MIRLVTSAVLFAAAGATGPATQDFLPTFLQYGAVGAFAFFGMWFMYRAYVKADAERTELNRKIREDVVPALVACTEALRETTSLLKERR